MTSDIAIGTTRLTKDFGQGRGLFGLDLEVRRGEILGFLGPNSPGLSRLLRKARKEQAESPTALT